MAEVVKNVAHENLAGTEYTPVIALVINNWYKLKLYWEGPEGFLGGISNFLEGGKGESGGLYFFLHLLKKEALFCGFFL